MVQSFLTKRKMQLLENSWRIFSIGLATICLKKLSLWLLNIVLVILFRSIHCDICRKPLKSSMAIKISHFLRGKTKVHWLQLQHGCKSSNKSTETAQINSLDGLPACLACPVLPSRTAHAFNVCDRSLMQKIGRKQHLIEPGIWRRTAATLSITSYTHSSFYW